MKLQTGLAHVTISRIHKIQRILLLFTEKVLPFKSCLNEIIAPAAFALIERLCLLKVNLKSMMTPRYLALSDHGMAVLLIIILLGCIRLREKFIAAVLVSLINMRRRKN